MTRLEPSNSHQDHPNLFVNLRWVLIVATVAFVLFQDLEGTPWRLVAGFVAAYLGSNLVVAGAVRRFGTSRALEAGVVLFDSAAISFGVWMTGAATADFFFLYFFVVFLSALSERLELIVTAAVLVTILHLGVVAGDATAKEIFTTQELLRVPLLFVVGIFFGYLTQRTRMAEREMVELREERRLRGEAMAGISHDIKNPLGVIEGMAEALLDDDEPLSPDQRNLVRRIHANARQIVSLSMNLIDLGRVEAGRLQANRTSLHLPEVVDDTLPLARSAAELKSIRLESHTDSCTAVEADPQQIRRMVWNLLDNAVKYTPEGGRVSLQLTDGPGHVELVVSDTGPGIPAEVRDAFEAGSGTAVSGGRLGTGLGLSLVRALAEANGGRVAIASSSAGTSIALRFPKTSPEARAVPASTIPAGLEAP